MKSKISVSVILAMGFLVFLIYGSKTIYGMRNQVVASEETLIGNAVEANDIKLALEYMDNSEIGWDIEYSIDNSIQTDSTFKTFYYTRYNTNSTPNVYMSGDDVVHSNNFSDKIEGDVGEITIQLADYYEYLPLSFLVSFDEYTSKGLLGENNIYKIKMPKDATLHISKEYNSTSIDSISVPYVNAAPPSVMIDGKIYFTITNLENQIYYEKSDQISIEYNITSGILVIKDKERLTYDDVEIIYPINLENDGTTTILGLTSVKDDKYLALATLEKQNIYIHLYDVTSNVLVKKEKVGEIPENMDITRFEIISNDFNLLTNYEYMEEDAESMDTLKVVGAVYNINESNEIKSILENEFYTKLVDEKKEKYYTNPEDMLFLNNKLYLVFRNYYSDNYLTSEDRLNSIVLLAMDEEDILYLGILRNSMIEDHTIGAVVSYSYYGMNNEEMFVQYHSRDISSVKFIK